MYAVVEKTNKYIYGFEPTLTDGYYHCYSLESSNDDETLKFDFIEVETNVDEIIDSAELLDSLLRWLPTDTVEDFYKDMFTDLFNEGCIHG